MTSIRLIPCLDIKDGRVVKGKNFVGLTDSGDPLELAKFYSDQGADELVFLDITASSDSRPAVIDLARRVAEQVFIPFTVGGGLRTVADIRAALVAGADKVSLNTAAILRPEFISEAATACGSQAVVLAIDAKREGDTWQVYTHGGRNRTDLNAVEWAMRGAALGAGEILLTSMDGDGSRQGYDLELTRTVCESVPVPVIASGGVGNAQHLIDGAKEGKADALLLAGILHEKLTTVRQLKEQMAIAGLPVRKTWKD